jgi:hypothetical protein
MISEDLAKKLKECFKISEKEEKEGRKHKGLLIVEPNDNFAKDYVKKAKNALEWCEIYKTKEADYKIPEEWFYALYYCALAFLAKLGVESRSQKYTSLFLSYLQDKNIVDYGKEFIDSIAVHKEKGKESEVDKREEARYSSSIRMDNVAERYDKMMEFCKKAISKTEEIIFSDKQLTIPRELK